MRLALCIAPFVLLLGAGAAGAEPSDVQVALKAIGFPADSEQRVLSGRFVRAYLPPRSERDLGVGVAFLVKLPPKDVFGKLREDRVMLRADPQTIAYGSFEGDGTLNQLAPLRLTPAQLKAYAAVAPGDTLNLSSAEIESLQSVGGDAAALERRVLELLLARYRSYRAQGLAGIAPYARRRSQMDPAADLRAVIRGARATRVLPTTFYDLLADYPEGVPADLSQVFYWAQFTARGQDTLSLVHSFQGTFGGQLVAVQRQYYVSADFNTSQAIVGFLPAPGGTLVVYTNRTSTDQLLGPASRTRLRLGRRLMAGELEKLFDAARREAAP
jgi:hypothetical protein